MAGADAGLAAEFEAERGRLTAVAQRLLGSRADAEDAVQETWVRLQRTREGGSTAGADEITNLGGWLTTVTSRVCLDVLRARRSRPEVLADEDARPPVRAGEAGPEAYAEAADRVGTALLVVLDALGPAERLAFVLHDVFAVPFDDIAAMIERSPAAPRQLASRARRRVRAEAPVPDPDLGRQREVVEAFLAASRDGDFDALVAVLDPDIVLRGDGGPTRPRLSTLLRGAHAVAGQAKGFRQFAGTLQPVLVNGAVGLAVLVRGRAFALMAFTVSGGRIAAMDVLMDPERLADLKL